MKNEFNLEQRKIRAEVTSIDYANSDTEFKEYGQWVYFFIDVFDVKTNKKLFSNLDLSIILGGIDADDFDDDIDKEFEKNYLEHYYDLIYEREFFENYTLGELFYYFFDDKGVTERFFIEHLAPELTKNDIIEIFGNEEIWIRMYNDDFWGDSDGFGMDKKKFKKAPEILSVEYDIILVEYYNIRYDSFSDLLVKKYFGNKIRVNKYWYSDIEFGSGLLDDKEFKIKLKDLDKVFGENFQKEKVA